MSGVLSQPPDVIDVDTPDNLPSLDIILSQISPIKRLKLFHSQLGMYNKNYIYVEVNCVIIWTVQQSKEIGTISNSTNFQNVYMPY